MQLEPHCKACKWKDSETGCPFYIGVESGFVETNEQGEVRMLTGCFMQQFFRMLSFLVKTNVGIAASVQSHRNEISRRVEEVGRLVASSETLNPPIELKAITKD